MRRKGYRGVGCVKRSLSKCEGICRTYDKVQTSFADYLQNNEKVKSFQCIVLMKNGEENQYTTDFVVEMCDGSKMVVYQNKPTIASSSNSPFVTPIVCFIPEILLHSQNCITMLSHRMDSIWILLIPNICN